MTVQDEPRRDNRFLMWTGHYSIRFMIPALLLIIGYNVAGRPGGTNGILSWVVTAVWALWFVTVIFDYNYHEERLCERCIAATPLDPQASVARWHRFLRIHHARRVAMRIAILVILWFFVGATFAGLHWWVYAINVACYVAIGVAFISMNVHRRLYPWCPYCRWGDGGEEEEVPDPAPAASAS